MINSKREKQNEIVQDNNTFGEKDSEKSEYTKKMEETFCHMKIPLLKQPRK